MIYFNPGDIITIYKPIGAYRKIRDDDVFLVNAGMKRLVCKPQKTIVQDWRLISLQVIRVKNRYD